MRSLRLALLGLWWRWPASVMVLFVAVAAATVAAAGPIYLSGARDAVLQTALRNAPVGPNGTGIEVTQAGGSRADVVSLAQGVAQAFAGNPAYRSPVLSIGSDRVVLGPDGRPSATVPLVYRQGNCAQLRISAGACVAESDPLGVDITAATAARLGWKVGTRIPLDGFVVHANRLDNFSLRVRGIYDPIRPDGAYWLSGTHQYFGQVSRFAAASVPRVDAVLSPASTWAFSRVDLADVVNIQADLTLNPDRVHVDNLPAFEQFVDSATRDVQVLAQSKNRQNAEVATFVQSVLATAGSNADSVRQPILVISAQLLVLAWIVLYLVLLSSSESRSAEIALGKLRGFKPRQSVLHALLEPLLLLVIAVPVGALVADLVVRSVGRSVLGSHATIALPRSAWIAAAVAGVGGLVAAGGAAVGVLRRSVLDQWRRTDRRPRKTGWAVEAAVVVASVAGFIGLLSSPQGSTTSAGTSNSAGFLAALAPGLLATTCALVGARLLPCIGGSRLRGTRFVALFVALRQVTRRRGDLRVLSLLIVAVALVVFGVGSRSVFEQNRLERARIDVGADRVVEINPDSGPNAEAVLARLDPGGTQAAAVYDGTLAVDSPEDVFARNQTTTAPSVLVVDPDRFAAVAYWRPDFGAAKGEGQTLAQALRAVQPDPVAPPGFTGDRLTLTALVKLTAGLGVDVHLGLTDPSGTAIDVDLGHVSVSAPAAPATAVHWSVAVPRCATGCLFRRLSMVTSVNDDATPESVVRVTGAEVTGAGYSTPTSVLPQLLSARWSPLKLDPTSGPSEDVSTTGGALTIQVPFGAFATDLNLGYGAQAAVPLAVPALATLSQLPADGSGDIPAQLGSDDNDLPLHGSAVRLLPHAGDAGVLLTRAALVAGRPNGYDAYAPNEIWLSRSAPADFPDRLAAAGLSVQGVESVADRSVELARQGPTFAVAMLVSGASAAGGLAVVGASAMFLVASRRRLYELAALRTLGLRPARLIGSLVLEQLLVSLLAALIGLAAGVAGTRIALARLPEFADRPSFPPLVINLPWLQLIGVGAALTIIMAAVAAIGGVVLVRRATPQRLREVQG